MLRELAPSSGATPEMLKTPAQVRAMMKESGNKWRSTDIVRKYF